MKKLIIIMTFLMIFITGFSQTKKIRTDSSFYIGKTDCFNTPTSRYIDFFYIQFLSSKSDSLIVIIPYRMKNVYDTVQMINNIHVMTSTITNYLSNIMTDVKNLEYYQIIDKPWSVRGFDTFVNNFETRGNKLTFELNIASDMITNEIEIFYFDGTIDRDGKEINAVIYSNKGTFKKSNIKLNLISSTED